NSHSHCPFQDLRAGLFVRRGGIEICRPEKFENRGRDRFLDCNPHACRRASDAGDVAACLLLLEWIALGIDAAELGIKEPSLDIRDNRPRNIPNDARLAQAAISQTSRVSEVCRTRRSLGDVNRLAWLFLWLPLQVKRVRRLAMWMHRRLAHFILV